MLWPGNGTCVQVDPLRRQAVGAAPPLPRLKAQPPFLPTAMTTLNPPDDAPWTSFTIRQAGVIGCAVRGAARAELAAAPVTVSPVTASTVAASRTAAAARRPGVPP